VVVDNGSNDDNVTPGANVPFITAVLDVVLTKKGIEEDIFRQSLDSVLIPYENEIAVDQRLEQSLLTHRWFGGIGADELPEPIPGVTEEEEHLRLVFVVARGRQFDQLFLRLSQAEGYVVATRMDLAIANSSAELLSQMDQLSRTENQPTDASLVRAHPLALQEDLQKRLFEALSLNGPKQGEPLNPVERPAEEPGSEAPPETEPMPPASDQIEQMEAMNFQVLFVLRSEGTVRQQPNP
jgi:hypothetical protein